MSFALAPFADVLAFHESVTLRPPAGVDEASFPRGSPGGQLGGSGFGNSLCGKVRFWNVMQLHMNSRSGILATTVQNEKHKRGAECKVASPPNELKTPIWTPQIHMPDRCSFRLFHSHALGVWLAARVSSQLTGHNSEHQNDTVRLVLPDLG